MQNGTTNSKGILIISILSLLAIAAYFIYFWSSLKFPDFYSPADKRAEYMNMLSHIPALLPALLGLYIHNKPWVTRLAWIGYLIYFALVLVSYSSILWSQDALEAGLLFVLLMPFSLLLLIYLLYLLIARGRSSAT